MAMPWVRFINKLDADYVLSVSKKLPAELVCPPVAVLLLLGGCALMPALADFVQAVPGPDNLACETSRTAIWHLLVNSRVHPGVFAVIVVALAWKCPS